MEKFRRNGSASDWACLPGNSRKVLEMCSLPQSMEYKSPPSPSPWAAGRFVPAVSFCCCWKQWCPCVSGSTPIAPSTVTTALASQTHHRNMGKKCRWVGSVVCWYACLFYWVFSTVAPVQIKHAIYSIIFSPFIDLFIYGWQLYFEDLAVPILLKEHKLWIILNTVHPKKADSIHVLGGWRRKNLQMEKNKIFLLEKSIPKLCQKNHPI